MPGRLSGKENVTWVKVAREANEWGQGRAAPSAVDIHQHSALLLHEMNIRDSREADRKLDSNPNERVNAHLPSCHSLSAEKQEDEEHLRAIVTASPPSQSFSVDGTI